MKKFFTLILAAGLVSVAMAQKTIQDANAEARKVSNFHGVAVSGSIELFLTQGSEESVAVSADDVKWRDKVVTEVSSDGILRIYLEHQSKLQLDWGLSSRKIRAYVSARNIDYISSAGSGKTHIEGNIKSDKLKIDISGSGNVEGDVSVGDFALGLSGSANADLKGNAENAELHISGSGNVRSYDFKTSYCKANISGSGNVKVTVSKELSAHISGSGSVMIKGDGLIRDYSASGSGKFKRVN